MSDRRTQGLCITINSTRLAAARADTMTLQACRNLIGPWCLLMYVADLRGLAACNCHVQIKPLNYAVTSGRNSLSFLKASWLFFADGTHEPVEGRPPSWPHLVQYLLKISLKSFSKSINQSLNHSAVNGFCKDSSCLISCKSRWHFALKFKNIWMIAL